MRDKYMPFSVSEKIEKANENIYRNIIGIFTKMLTKERIGDIEKLL